jgi:outer membrane protein OmpA-like peptidoglycan-associated protein
MFARASESSSSPKQVRSSAAEAEADCVADDVMATSANGVAQRIRPVPMPAVEGASESASRSVSRTGAPLPAETQRTMESRFGQDFSRVRVHTDASAARSARALNAAAYTIGHDIAFSAGRYAPSTDAGRRLIAHELTHVVQQAQSGARFQAKPDTENPTPQLRAPTAATFAAFAHGGSQLTAEHGPLVQSLAQLYFRMVATSPGVKLLLTGHTDLTGEERRNVELGRQRAAAVAAGLVRAGAPADFIRIESAGEREPVVQTPEREPRNRRVEARFEQIPSKFEKQEPWTFSPIDPSKVPPSPSPIVVPPRTNPTVVPPAGSVPMPAPSPGGGAGPGPAGPSRDDRAPENAPRSGKPGDIAEAVVKYPEIARIVDDARNKGERDWKNLKPGEKVPLIVVGATIVAGALAAAATDPALRGQGLDALDGQTVTVPGAPWLKATIKTKGLGGVMTLDLMKLFSK